MCHPGDHIISHISDLSSRARTVVEYYIVQVTRLSENMRMQKCDGRRGKGEGLLRGMPPPPAATISPGCSRDLGAKLRRLAQSPATQRLPAGGRGTPSCQTRRTRHEGTRSDDSAPTLQSRPRCQPSGWRAIAASRNVDGASCHHRPSCATIPSNEIVAHTARAAEHPGGQLHGAAIPATSLREGG